MHHPDHRQVPTIGLVAGCPVPEGRLRAGSGVGLGVTEDGLVEEGVGPACEGVVAE